MDDVLSDKVAFAFNDYLRLPRECVYALVCDETKRFVVGYTEHLMGAIYRVSTHLETPKYMHMRCDIEKIKVVILEVGIQNKINKKILVSYYFDKYKALGYSEYYPSNLVRYSVHTEIITRYGVASFLVYLKDKRGNRVPVGIFRKKTEMVKFIDTYYPNYQCKGIYYADNSFTDSIRNKVNELSK